MSGVVLPAPGRMSAERAEELLEGARVAVECRTAEQLRIRLTRDGWSAPVAQCLASAPEALRTVVTLTKALDAANGEIEALRARIKAMHGDLDRAEAVVALDRAGAPTKGPDGQPLSIVGRIQGMGATIDGFHEVNRAWVLARGAQLTGGDLFGPSGDLADTPCPP